MSNEPMKCDRCGRDVDEDEVEQIREFMQQHERGFFALLVGILVFSAFPLLVALAFIGSRPDITAGVLLVMLLWKLLRFATRTPGILRKLRGGK